MHKDKFWRKAGDVCPNENHITYRTRWSGHIRYNNSKFWVSCGSENENMGIYVIGKWEYWISHAKSRDDEINALISMRPRLITAFKIWCKSPFLMSIPVHEYFNKVILMHD